MVSILLLKIGEFLSNKNFSKVFSVFNFGHFKMSIFEKSKKF